VGITSLGSATQGQYGMDILSLCVLSSDEVSFSLALTGSLEDEQEKPIQEAYKRAAGALGGAAPSLVLAFVPMLNHVGGERLMQYVDKASNGVPVFGTMACDHNFDFCDAHVLYNGEQYKDCLAMVLAAGPVNAEFFTIAVSEEKIQKNSAVITGSQGNVVYSVNDRPVLEYLESIGLASSAGLEGSRNIPFMLDYNDGTPPVARCFYMISPEGHAICGGEMPVNSTFALGRMDGEDVLRSAETVLDRIREKMRAQGMIIVSCIGRSVSLGFEPLAESARVQELLGSGIPYFLCYSGGEICPVYDGAGRTANRFHNFSFTVCVFPDARTEGGYLCLTSGKIKDSCLRISLFWTNCRPCAAKTGNWPGKSRITSVRWPWPKRLPWPRPASTPP
jgi:hypothetical protein